MLKQIDNKYINTEGLLIYFYLAMNSKPNRFSLGLEKMNPTLSETLIQPNPAFIVWVWLVRVVGLNVHP